MKYFVTKGNKKAIRLEFTGFKNCDKCGFGHHTLYFYHGRLVCGKHLPKDTIKVSIKKIPTYVSIKI